MNKYAHANGQIIDTEAQEIILGGDAVADRLNALEAERDALRDALREAIQQLEGTDIADAHITMVSALAKGEDDESD